MKKIKSTYIAMVVITITVLIVPLLLRIPIVSQITSWGLMGLREQEYKSAYLGIISSLVGSWLAISGAIYAQGKFEDEKRREIETEKKNEIRTKHNITIIMCKELLWNEILANHHSLYGEKGDFLNALKQKQKNWHYNGVNRYRLENWFSIREKVIQDHLECAIKVMKLYKYYEFLAGFSGTASEAADLSQIDFNQYVDIYEEVRQYLGIGEE